MVHYKNGISWIPFSHLEDSGIRYDHKTDKATVIRKGEPKEESDFSGTSTTEFFKWVALKQSSYMLSKFYETSTC